MPLFKKSYAAVVSSSDSESETNLCQEKFITELLLTENGRSPEKSV